MNSWSTLKMTKKKQAKNTGLAALVGNLHGNFSLFRKNTCITLCFIPVLSRIIFIVQLSITFNSFTYLGFVAHKKLLRNSTDLASEE